MVKCNDVDGVMIILISVEGGFELDDNEDYVIFYIVILMLLVLGLVFIIFNVFGGFGLNNVSVSEFYSGLISLVIGVLVMLLIIIIVMALWVGGYLDMLIV